MQLLDHNNPQYFNVLSRLKQVPVTILPRQFRSPHILSLGFPDGMPENLTLRSLDIIRPKDMPPVDVILVEATEPNSPYGIKGVGEIGLVPTAGAVAAALHARDGEWRTELPLINEANRERAGAWTK